MLEQSDRDLHIRYGPISRETSIPVAVAADSTNQTDSVGLGHQAQILSKSSDWLIIFI